MEYVFLLASDFNYRDEGCITLRLVLVVQVSSTSNSHVNECANPLVRNAGVGRVILMEFLDLMILLDFLLGCLIPGPSGDKDVVGSFKELDSIGSRIDDSLSNCDSLVDESREEIDFFEGNAATRKLDLIRSESDVYPILDNMMEESNCSAAIGVGNCRVEGSCVLV